MSKCDQDGCTGHLGKFESCLSEAIWQDSLEGWEVASTGTTEYEGHLTLMHYDEASTVNVDHGPTVTVPAGWYIVFTTDRGAVYLWTYQDEAAARKEFDGYDRRYSEWDSEWG